jgi:peptidoglycan/xylan/chitin deacetylase (PgdA/CDA1 family)
MLQFRLFRPTLIAKTAIKLVLLGTLAVCCGCDTVAPHPLPLNPPGQGPVTTPIRFLLTFDDGPASSSPNGPTESILRDLADNTVQPGIKAVFFLQTRAQDAGGSPFGRELMRREFVAGHVLAFHTATPHHSNHRHLEPDVFEQSLMDGTADIGAVTGAAPQLVRPPFWNFDQRTFSAYQAHGLHILLTDLSANDGKIWGVNFSLRRRSNMLHQLDAARAQIAAGALPTVDGAIPIVVTFHDINTYTARHMQEYLKILEECANELNLPMAAKPFYDERAALERAALARTVTDPALPVHLPGLWNWIWNH